MDSPGDILEYWRLILAPIIFGIVGWLAKHKKTFHPYRWLVGQTNVSLRERVARLENQIEICEDTLAASRQARQYALEALKELTTATVQAVQTGTISTSSSTGPEKQ